MFAYNMFLRPTAEELKSFDPEWLVVNAPGFMANPEVDGTRQHNFAILNFSKKIALIGGTGYTGEIKKGIFSALNFILPVYKNTLPMHCSANVGTNGDTAIFFGSSGTITDADTWVDIGSSDLPIFIDFSAGTSGVGNITVEYIQNINNA